MQLSGVSKIVGASLLGLAACVERIADVDHDNDTDVIWRHVYSGDVSVWVMDGHQRLDSGTPTSRPAPWALTASN